MLATAEQGAPVTPLKWALPDGTPATYAILWCSRGGVSWPEIIVAYTAGPTLAGYLDLGQQSFPGVEGSEHAEVQSWAETDTGLALSLTTYEGAGFDIYTYQGFLDFENGGLVLNDITVVSGPENPR